uniref:Diphthine methyl ester synthase n=1 Tax=Brassica oleracea var. oleracea TaxID=109376 RepID=A0A0D3DXG0_BRAOL
MKLKRSKIQSSPTQALCEHHQLNSSSIKLLGDESDITLRGLEAVKKSQKISLFSLLVNRATTHSDLVVRAKKLGVHVEGGAQRICDERCWDLSSAALPLRRDDPCSWTAHALRVKEPTFESLCRGGKKQYEQLLEVEQKRGDSVYSEETECVGFARLGAEDQKILSGTMKQLESVDCGAPLHCLVIVGKTHPVEEEMLDGVLQIRNCKLKDHMTEEGSRGRQERSRCLSE